MTDLWYPTAIAVHAPETSWGHYVGATPYRGVLHTTETDHYQQSTASYFGSNFWPHATIGERADGTRGIFQHIPVNRAARALKNPAGGVETNNAHAVQCEIVWHAHDAKLMPDWLLELVADWMRWVESVVDIQPEAVTFFGDDAGFTVASVNAKQRMTGAAWNAFNGWCGHQHVPENDHWDPGHINIDRLLELGDEDMSFTDSDRATLNATRTATAQLVGAMGGVVDLLNLIKADVENPDSHGGAGQITAEALDAHLHAALEKQAVAAAAAFKA